MLVVEDDPGVGLANVEALELLDRPGGANAGPVSTEIGLAPRRTR